MDPIDFIASIITEDPDIIVESAESKVISFLRKNQTKFWGEPPQGKDQICPVGNPDCQSHHKTHHKAFSILPPAKMSRRGRSPRRGSRGNLPTDQGKWQSETNDKITAIAKFSASERFTSLGISKWIASVIAPLWWVWPANAPPPYAEVGHLLPGEQSHGRVQDICDYLLHLKRARGIVPSAYVRNKSYDQINQEQQEWHESLKDQDQDYDDSEYKADEQIVEKFSDGFTMVKLATPEHCEREGALMGHCVKDHDPTKEGIYSLRDGDNKPYATIGSSLDGKTITQIKGENNEPLLKKCTKYVFSWLDEYWRFPDDYTEDGQNDYAASTYDINKLRKWANSNNDDLKLVAARNSNTPEDALIALHKHYVRKKTYGAPNDYGNRRQKARRLEMMQSVDKSIAGNANAPEDLLRKIFNMHWESFQYLVSRHSKVESDGITPLIDIYYNIAKNINTPEDILRKLAYMEEHGSKGAEAPKERWVLEKNSLRRIRRALANNANTPEDLKAHLLGIDEEWIS